MRELIDAKNVCMSKLRKKNDAIINNNDVTHAEDGVGMRVLLTLYVFIKSSERSRLYVGMVTIRFGDVFLLDAIK